MAALNPARWAALSPQIDELLTLPPLQRAQRLDEIAANDPRTAGELRELLAASADASRVGFMGGAADAGLAPPAPASAAHIAQAGAVLGAWTLVEAIGEGGMGTVWRARRSDGRYEGVAAIKLLKSGLFDSAAQERFRREGGILARLNHPGIAQLLDAGVSPQGQPYLVLELVQGLRIDRWCGAQGLSVRQRIELFLQVLDAVQAAHAQLTIHRDLKPSNILVDDSGRVKLLDFGIARLLPEAQAEQTALTREGSFALTPEYAAPEQFEGGVLSVATDVYTLGIVLVELLAGANPGGLPGQPPLAYLQRAHAGLPLASRCARDGGKGLAAEALRGDLDAILARALRVDPGDRFPTVPALADDLRRYLAHQPVLARGGDWRYRLRRLLRRRRLETALAAGVVMAVCTGLAATAWQWRRAEAQRDAAHRQLVRASSANDFSAALLTEVANVGHPLSFDEILQRGEQLALAHGSTRVQQAYALVALAQFHATSGAHDKTVRLAEAAASAARQAGDTAIGAMADCLRGSALVFQGGDGPAAERLVDDALRRSVSDAEAQALCLNNKGLIALLSRQGALAVELNEKALALMLSIPGYRLSQVSAVYFTLGQAHGMQGHHAEGQAAFRESLALLQRAGLGESSDAASVLQGWSVLETESGQTQSALALAERGLAIEVAAVGEAQVGAVQWDSLANSMTLVGRLDEARTMALRARDAADKGDSRQTQISSRRTLANVARNQGRHAEAQAHLEEAARFAATLPPHSQWRLAVRVAQAQLHRAMGQPRQALNDLSDARAALDLMSEKAGGKAKLPLPWMLWLNEQAATLTDDGQATTALPLVREAVALARQLQHGAPSSSQVGRMLLTQARAQAAVGDTAAALASAREAQTQLLDTVGPAGPALRDAQTLLARWVAPGGP